MDVTSGEGQLWPPRDIHITSFPWVVYKDNPPTTGADGRFARYRIETVEGDNFYIPNFRQVMKFLQYHGCYGVREDEMMEMRRARPGEGRASAREQ